MQIIGIGTDIIQIERIRDSMNRYGSSFAKRILHPNELGIFNACNNGAAYLAKRFAAKEAVAKALGTGIAQGVSFVDIETCNNAEGKPELRLHGGTQKKADELGVQQSHLSLSDEKEYAVAYVVLTGFINN
jgi:holo-[acyl-carrier protein] synthase